MEEGNQHYKIMTCPSDNSESPTVHKRGYSFIGAANDYAFKMNGKDDGNDYWPTEDDELQL